MLTEKDALALLKKHATSATAYRKVLAHGKAVARLSLQMAARMRVKTNRQFLLTAAILHDIGRFPCPPPGRENAVRHGIAGAAILRKEGLPKHALAAERHVGSGITRTEAKKLGLPVKSYLPQTLEEKIVCYADSLTFGDQTRTLAMVLERYRKEVGEALVRRTKRLHNSLQRLMR